MSRFSSIFKSNFTFLVSESSVVGNTTCFLVAYYLVQLTVNCRLKKWITLLSWNAKFSVWGYFCQVVLKICARSDGHHTRRGKTGNDKIVRTEPVRRFHSHLLAHWVQGAWSSLSAADYPCIFGCNFLLANKFVKSRNSYKTIVSWLSIVCMPSFLSVISHVGEKILAGKKRKACNIPAFLLSEKRDLNWRLGGCSITAITPQV